MALSLLVADLSSTPPTRTTTHTAALRSQQPPLGRVSRSRVSERAGAGCQFRVATRIFPKFDATPAATETIGTDSSLSDPFRPGGGQPDGQARRRGGGRPAAGAGIAGRLSRLSPSLP